MGKVKPLFSLTYLGLSAKTPYLFRFIVYKCYTFFRLSFPFRVFSAG